MPLKKATRTKAAEYPGVGAMGVVARMLIPVSRSRCDRTVLPVRSPVSFRWHGRAPAGAAGVA